MTRARPLLSMLVIAVIAIAPAWTINPPRSSAATVTQTGTLLMHPQIAQSGSSAGSAAQAKSAMSAVFRPVRKGRKVILQRLDGKRWVSVATSAQDGRGAAQFTAPYSIAGRAQVYRSFTVRTRTLQKTTTRGVSTSAWETPTFSDEFGGTALSADWTHRLQGYSAPSKRKCSKADPSAVSVGGGQVRLSVLSDPMQPYACTYGGKRYRWRLNGHIGTQGTQSFSYGYAAARIRFQPRPGQHASFWMQPETRTATEGSPLATGAEIDIIEWFGNGSSDGLCNFVYDYPDDGKADSVTARKSGACVANPRRYGTDWATKYHVFSVEWTPQRYIFRIDGKETYRTSVGVSGQREYLILSLLSSDYELARLGGDHRLPQHMYVDWVRYWER